MDYNDTAQDVPATTLPALFEAQVRRTPDNTAVVFEDTTLTYAQLNARANRLARLLIERGVGPEQFVALAVPRSVEMIVAVLAVLKAGAAYLPIDPDYPPARIKLMLDDAQPACLVTTAATALPDTGGLPVIVLDHADTVEALRHHADADPDDADRIAPLHARHPAYVIYTSGSTGMPKGVVVEHRNVVELALDSRVRRRRPRAGARPLAADVRRLHLRALGPAARRRPGRRRSTVRARCRHASGWLVAEHGITGLLVDRRPVPPDRGRNAPECFDGLHELWVGGDVRVRRVAVRQVLAACPGLVVVNGYGPTETTTFAACHPILGPDEVGDVVPIGRPIANTQLYVLDAGLQLVPAGVGGRALHRRGGSGPGLPEPARTERRALRGLPLRPPRQPHVPHRRPGALERRGRAGLRRPGRRPGQAAGLSHRAG